ncbi:S8 family serine peptidase [Stieleria sp. ICT_E10.1]|uniref:Calx-beta domain-containing protein n=1 Tax=Stieleria sedimenti TaxID=2976331 RepID=UPI00217FF91D|nr:Calx-beta domain-containing protein [Stieleria sedimenti]MCS7465423.1 S8 family serine peptidase [Stieleria sedimenti]
MELLEKRFVLDGSLAAIVPGLVGADTLESNPADVPTQILVKLNEDFEDGSRRSSSALYMGPLQQTAPPVVQSLLGAVGAISLSSLFSGEHSSPSVAAPPLPLAGATEASAGSVDRSELDLWYRLDLWQEDSIESALASVSHLPGIKVAEPNVEWGLANQDPRVIEVLPDGTTDPGYDEQWFHDTTSTWKAWDHLNTNGVYPGGKRDVVVAVIDTGVDYTHENLAANMWVNPGEIPGNGIDDDGNGFVDDIHGASVVSNPNAHTGDPIDYHGHGTHVAGIIAGQAFNGVGGVGVAFNTQIMAIRAAQSTGTLTVDDIAEAILYAVDNGAEVINMSFGGYQRSQVVEDALEIALNQAVLVAAAGNDSINISQAPIYPASLPWVLGVEASTPNDTLANFSNSGYEVRAPGESIYSTLPNNQYAKWSGTSMATPVVTGIAALMRSYYWQRDIYSSRFIMGGIADSGSGQNSTGVVDAFKAVTTAPKPGVSLYENWLFDDESIKAGNDDDGRIDSGETVHIAVELINRAGMAEDVTVTLSARARGAVQDDPYVTIDVDTVAIGNIGPFAFADNGLIWNQAGEITGVASPFVVTIDPGTPNDHVIPFVMTTTFVDGSDEDKPSYTRVERFEYVVQRGKNVPRVIDEDTVLSAEDLWVVGGPVLVEPQATLTIPAGTQVQWGAVSDDPLNSGPQTGSLIVRGKLSIEGTEENPVELFPSYLVGGQQTNVTVDGGTADIAYANIRNPKMTGLNHVDHVYLDWDNYSSQFTAQYIANSIFHRYQGSSLSAGVFETVLFDESRRAPSSENIVNTTFLQDNQNNSPLSLSVPSTYHEELTERPTHNNYFDILDPRYHEGYTYAVLPMEWDNTALAEKIANYYGGHLVSIHNQDELDWIQQYVKFPKPQAGYQGYVSNFLLGATTFNIAMADDPSELGTWNEYRWVDGTPMDYTNWAEGQPALQPNSRAQEIVFNPTTAQWWTRLATGGTRWGGHGHPQNWPGYIIKVPGEWTYEEMVEPFDNGELLAHVDETLRGTFRYNAFLSKLWSPNLNHWMRLRTANNGIGWTSELTDNYWGTDNPVLVDYAIHDYVDDFVSARADYGTLPSHGFESTFPFVENVYFNGIPAAGVPELGAGPTTYTVVFNRDMDPAKQPFVAFGPVAPFTDFAVHPSGQSFAEFTVRLSQPSSRRVAVHYKTVDGTAIAGVDYQGKSGRVEFAEGQIERVIKIPLLGDHAEESDLSFSLQLSEPTFADLLDSVGVATIVDDDPTLSVSDAALTEGDSGSTEMEFTVSLSKSLDETVTVEFWTINDAAIAGSDYEATRGELSFAPGQTQATFTVSILDDGVHESDESFTVKIGYSNRVNVADAIGQGMILDNDPLIRIGNAEILEGDSGQVTLSFPVSLSKATDKTITADFATADKNAIAGADYVAAAGTITFVSGGPLQQTVTVEVLGDTAVERNETFFVQLTNIVGADVGTTEALGTILSDDGPVFSIDNVSIVEADGWSSYFGAEGNDTAYQIDRDHEGNTWVVGRTSSGSIGKNSFDNTYNGGSYDALIAKFAPDGQLLWSRYLGGSADDGAGSITIDENGFAWVVGWTRSGGWVSGGFDHQHNGDLDAFVARLTPDGEVMWSSYIGGAGEDSARDVALDSVGNAWIVGDTASDNWTSDGFDRTFGGATDMMLAKVTPGGSLLWSGYFGAAGTEYGRGIEIDASDHAVIVGTTNSAGLADDGFDVSHNGGWDAIVAKFSSDGVPAWSTYLGGPGTDQGLGIALDPTGDAWVTGDTGSAGWVSGGFDDSHNGGQDAFLAKVTADGQQIPWSTYFGHSGHEYPQALDVDATGTVWIAGYANSVGWVSDGPDVTHGGGEDGFLAKIDTTANELDWSMYYGGAASDRANDVTLDETGTPWVVGETSSGGWTAGGADTWHAGGQDIFLARTTDEPAWHVEYTVSLSETPTEEMLVDYETRDGSALAYEDYLPIEGRLTFVPGEPLLQTLRVAVLADEKHELNEEFTLELFNNVNGISAPHGITTIVDEDPLVSVSGQTVVENHSGTTSAIVEISLASASVQPVVVDYATVEGTATAGSDFQPVAGTLTFLPGETTKQVSIPVIGDTVDELDETFHLALAHVAEGVVAPDLESITIEDDDDPSLTIQGVTVLEESGQAGIVVSLSSAPLEKITVEYATSDGTATSGDDYLSAQGTLTFLPGGPTDQSIMVPIIADENDEADETVLVNLSGATNAFIDEAQAVVSISDTLPLINIGDVSIVEGDTGTANAVFTVSLSASSIHSVTVDFATADGSGEAGTDYTAAAGTLTFAPGETEKEVAVLVHGDTVDETNESFSVLLSHSINASVGDAEGIGTIIGNDGPLLSINDLQLLEGDIGTSTMQFTVDLSAVATEAFQVSYETEDGTATADSDYSPVTGTLLFNPGDSSKTLLVPIHGNEVHEGDEWFSIKLHGATVVGISDPVGIGTILGDDPSISISDATLTETDSGNPVMSFTVSLSQDPVDTVTVQFATADETAAAGSDYLFTSGTLTFSPGGAVQQTIDVNLIGDVNNEIHEQFAVQLSNVVNAELIDGQAVGTILDDDGAKLVISDATLVEGDAGTTQMVFDVSLTEAANQSVTVDYATEDGTAGASDYQTWSGSLTFDIGTTSQTILVPITGDDLDEVDETFQVRLSNAVGVPVLDDVGQGTIADDDQATISVDDVVAVEGFDGWLNSRIWQGSHVITPMTGESYHEMRISGAAAVDDPWLVSGNDIGRFRFKVRTMGVEAMTLHATGEEGHIALGWDQDDFDLLAGYHLYRSDSEHGTYTRLNQTIIPVGQESYIDWDVTPTETMHYKFTVVQTDTRESDPSNIASSAASDTVAPIIEHAPKTSAFPNASLRLTSVVTDNAGVKAVAVHYRPRGSTDLYVSLAAVNVVGDEWTVTIPGGAVQPPGIEYYLTATDGITQVYHGTAAAPHTAIVVATPVLTSVSPNQGSVDGGTRVTLTGALFQENAIVEFGGLPATDVVVQTSGQILATTPAHFPTHADVRVVNPDSTETTKLNGFYYVDDNAVLSLPTLTGDPGAVVDIPVSLADADGLRSVNLSITFDPTVLRLAQATDVSTGTLTSGWSIETNILAPGRVQIVLAGSSPITGSGTVANLQLSVVGAVATQSELSFENAVLNVGAIIPDLSNGVFAVNGFFTLGGTVSYFQDARPVPGTRLDLVGVGQQNDVTASTGTFTFNSVLTGAYELKPDKNDQVVGISALDATAVLRNVAGLQALNVHQQMAADVNGIDGITALDASYILQKSVGNITGTFPGAGKYWDFAPGERIYPLITGDLINQDFTAVLIGDVTGSWNADGSQNAPVGGNALQGDTVPFSLDLVDVTGEMDQVVTVPLELDIGSSLAYAVDMAFSYDNTLLEIQDVTIDAAGTNLFWEKNTSQSGDIRVSMAGSQPFSSDGTLLNFQFKILRSLDAPTQIVLEQASFDEGAVAATAHSGFVADTTPPQVSVDTLTTNDNTPEISGTIDDPTAVVLVTVGGQTYNATNRGDGTWVLPDGSITTQLADGVYDVQATATDVITRTTADLSGNELVIDTVGPVPQHIVVGDGSNSRSMLTEVVVTFDGVVTLEEGAIEVNKRGVGGGSVDLNVSVVNSGVQTTATITFVGGFVEGSGSLSDGNYDLTIKAGLVHDAAFNVLDGNGDGTSGDDRVWGAAAVDGFYRLFGDSDGDRDVDGQDYGRFGLSFLKLDGDPGFDPRFDSDGDGDVDGQDYGRFGLRFLTGI